MGIPKMFRFLTDRYPLILQRLDEDHVFDNFYLDMNGIIHQCTHPSDTAIHIEDMDEMFARIFHYTERLYRIVSPTSLMFLAVDGVAPRAKMNQQRSRRFRSAKEAERVMSDAISRGDEIPEGVPFDSNCITPGTEFMFELGSRFREWIDNKMSSDPAWQQGCTVVFSGPDVPGEGEHKIMDCIRAWQDSDDYSPAVRHCMYGLDADLMMLGLVTHAPRFTLLREKIKFSKSGRKTPTMRGTSRDAEEFELLELAKLRDMLFLEFKRGNNGDPTARPKRSPGAVASSAQSNDTATPQFAYDSSRIVDDFVFMCMLVGNDFIPNLPHLDIAEGAITLMFRTYKRLLPKWRGYLTARHRIHRARLEAFLQEVSRKEQQYFSQRAISDGQPGFAGPQYRRTYYKLKFNFDVEEKSAEQKVSRLRDLYIEGLHWVLQYYHNGVSSWNWFYPEFYAVLASDMKNLPQVQVSFERGQPFRPLTQLMAVLPPSSAQFLPEPMQDLMTNPLSAVADFYPTTFVTDQNGKRNEWEAVVIVPFIDEERLLNEVDAIHTETLLTKRERERDQCGQEHWFYAEDYPRSDVKIEPVRPSKFVLPERSRSRSPSHSPPPGRDGVLNSPSSSRRRRSEGFSRRSGRRDSDKPYQNLPNAQSKFDGREVHSPSTTRRTSSNSMRGRKLRSEEVVAPPEGENIVPSSEDEDPV